MRVELQAEVSAQREDIFALISTSDGLRRWLDDAKLNPEPGSQFRLQLAGAEAVGRVVAVARPQHVSLAWDWASEPLGSPTAVAFDLISHGHRTHLTLRHVGFAREADHAMHEQLWRYWFGRLIRVAGQGPAARGAG